MRHIDPEAVYLECPTWAVFGLPMLSYASYEALQRNGRGMSCLKGTR
jgi:hypothetical protein